MGDVTKLASSRLYGPASFVTQALTPEYAPLMMFLAGVPTTQELAVPEAIHPLAPASKSVPYGNVSTGSMGDLKLTMGQLWARVPFPYGTTTK